MDLVIQPPTSFLPHQRTLASITINQLASILQRLQVLYSPAVRGSRRKQAPTSSSALAYDELESLRRDTFERNYALRWLTSLIEHLLLHEDEDDTDTSIPGFSTMLSTASSLLALCAGTSAAGALKRTFTFPAPSLSAEALTVTLEDAALDTTISGVGAQTWGGACVLAELIAENPLSFLPSARGKVRVLELGSGTGLVSITLARILALSLLSPITNTYAGAEIEIVATDFYPSVLTNLRQNITSNGVPVSTRFLDWESFMPYSDSQSESGRDDWKGEQFDIILGADLVYEPMHAIWLRACVQTLLRSDARAVFHLVIPHRATHAFESRSVEDQFPPVLPAHVAINKLRSTLLQPYGRDSAVPSPLTSPPPAELELGVLEMEEIVCEVGDAEEDGEVMYGIYKIGWGIRV